MIYALKIVLLEHFYGRLSYILENIRSPEQAPGPKKILMPIAPYILQKLGCAF